MARRKKGHPVNGWLVLDKPLGLTSTQALGKVRRLFDAQKAGHAGTLDPLATGVLPIAFGEATKTVSYAVDGAKSYTFTVAWGTQTTTDDSEGEAVATSDLRPAEAEIIDRLDPFIGEISQVPPKFSAIKVNGNRAYDLARDGDDVELNARTVTVDDLRLINCDNRDHAVFSADCGKGTYIRAIARDLGVALGCYGHVTKLRRESVAGFDIDDAFTMPELEQIAQSGLQDLGAVLRPVDDALKLALPALRVSQSDAANLSRGQPVLMRGRDAPVEEGPVYATFRGVLVAIGEARKGSFHPIRVFNLGQ